MQTARYYFLKASVVALVAIGLSVVEQTVFSLALDEYVETILIAVLAIGVVEALENVASAGADSGSVER
jgi:anti-sigma regulatory factor (Ser/Thr protein kinase)